MPSVNIGKDKFMDSIRSGFISRDNIREQFELDYPRVKLVINGEIVQNKLSDVLDYICHKTHNINMYYDFLMCCTQSTMVTPLEKLSTYLPLFIPVDSGDPLIIMINISNNICFLIHKKMNMFSINQKTNDTRKVMSMDIQIRFRLDTNDSVEIKYQNNMK